MSARLSGLTIGALNLTPAFNPDVTGYTATTTNAITATPEDENASVSIVYGETSLESGKSAAWADGENIVTVKVTNGHGEKVYTVTVMKEAGA